MCINEDAVEYVVCEMDTILSRGNELRHRDAPVTSL